MKKRCAQRYKAGCDGEGRRQDELVSALGVRADVGTYSLFAAWNAVYKVDVPTSQIAMSIDVTTREGIISDKEVSVRNASPRQIYVGACPRCRRPRASAIPKS